MNLPLNRKTFLSNTGLRLFFTVIILSLFISPATARLTGMSPDFSRCRPDTGGGILPLHNFSLTVTLKENTVYLKWLAENEMNTEKFIVQRSTDGIYFGDFSMVLPSGPINVLTTYNSADDVQQTGAAILYYRIKAQDSRNNYAYSNVVPVRLSVTESLRCWPNPYGNDLKISFRAASAGSLNAELTDLNGRVIIRQEVRVNKGINQFSFLQASQVKPGVYFVRLTDLSGGGSQQAVVIKAAEH